MSKSITRRTVRVDFADGNHLVTDINGTEQEIRDYYAGQFFNFGDTEEHPADRMVEAVRVTFLDAPVNPYEAKIEARRERYQELAAKKAAESDALAGRAMQLASHIPMGQPILVDHYSAKRHRSHLKQIDNTMRKAVETEKVADYYAKKAETYGTTGISSDDPEAVVKLRAELAELEAMQAKRVAANKIITNKKLTPEQKRAQIEALGMTPADFKRCFVPDCMGAIGFPSYSLSNNSANIRRIKQRIEQLLREHAQRPAETTETDTGRYQLIEDVEDNRLLIVFPSRAPQSVCDILKRHGFRWAPSKGAWSRMLNANSRATERYIRPQIEECYS